MLSCSVAKSAEFWPIPHFQLHTDLQITLPPEPSGKCLTARADIAITLVKCRLQAIATQTQSIKDLWKQHQRLALIDLRDRHISLGGQVTDLSTQVTRTEDDIRILQAKLDAIVN